MIRLFYNTLKSKSVDNFLLTNIFSLNPLRFWGLLAGFRKKTFYLFNQLIN